MGACRALAARLAAIQWDDRSTAGKSQVRLLQEYLRRCGLWARELGAAQMAFCDIALRVRPDVRAPASVIDEVKLSFGLYGSYYMTRTVEYALHFAAVEDAGGPMPDLPEPFFPLLRLYERGGFVTRDGTGMIDLIGASVPRGDARRWAAVEPLTAFDDESLDRMDAAREPQRS